MTLKLPNFLIVGAAKCGTSSFYYYLRNHPQIYMSSLKEPHHFSTQNVDANYQGIGDYRRPYVKNFEDYCKLFMDVQDEIAVGEASTDTLSTWQTSIPAINDKLIDPRIIIMLRNPVERAYSAYLHLVRENREYLSFEDGLKMEEERIKNNWHGLWHYAHRGFYFHQVKPFLDEFSKVKVFLNEDFNKDPQSIITQTCEFLEIATDYQSPYINVRYNTSGIPRSTALNYLFIMKNPIQRSVRKIAHRVFTEDGWIALRDSMRAKLMVKPKMKPETRASLKKVFRDDILKLQDLLGMDLSVWLDN
jgi:hypothetical protein